MKLNNRGWGFREMVFYMAVLVVFLFIAVFLIIRMYRQMDQKNYDISDYFPEGETTPATKKEVLLYSDLELELKNATVTYLKNYYEEELTSEKVAITLTMLKTKNLITSFKDVRDKSNCDGYTLVSINKDLVVSYYPYIKCANYTTVGYIESYTK
jgi:transcription initiation factor IIF auxiliary subunit